MRLLLIYVFLLSSICHNALAREQDRTVKQYLQFANFEIQHLPEQVRDQVRKSSYNFGMRLKQYEILIGNQRSALSEDISLHEISVRITPTTWREGQSQGYNIEVKLIDKNNDEILNQITRPRIHEHQIVFNLNQILSNIFNAKRQEMLTASLESGDNSPDSETTTASELGDRSSPPPPDKNNDPDDESSYEEQSLDSKEKKNDKNEPEVSRNKREQEITISNFSSPDIDLTRGDNPIKPTSNNWEFIHSFSAGLIVARESISSVDIIDVTNQVLSSGLTATHQMYFNGLNSNSLLTRATLMKPVSKTDFKFKPRTIINTHYVISRFRTFVQPFAGLGHSSSSFVNLGRRAEGLRHFDSSAEWALIGLRFDGRLVNLNSRLNLSVGKSISARTNFSSPNSTFEMAGNLLSIDISQKVWGILDLYYEMRRYQFTSEVLQDFVNTHNEHFIGVIARF
jgi:hypothetical protein